MRSLLLFFLVIFSQAEAATKAALVPVVKENRQSSNEELEYRMLKLETKINDLLQENAELRQQIKNLDIIQAQLRTKINEIAPAEDQFTESHKIENVEEFKYGYEMLRAGDYDKARRSFELFIDKYPEDGKLGEAYFWLGEIAYKAKDYKAASKNYLISYRDFKENSRRNDSLFKLSIVLGVLEQKAEACAGFDLLINDISTVAQQLREKAINEAINLGCSKP